MKPKKQIPKIKIKTVSNRDMLFKLDKEKNIKYNDLFKIFSYKHQKLHQLYSKKKDHFYNEDDEKYISIFQKMKKYNKIYHKNNSLFLQKKNENKEFMEEYIKFKQNSKKLYKDEIKDLYGNLIQKYKNKNLEFSQKFLSGKTIFKESGLLMTTKKTIEDFYHDEINKNGRNSPKAMKDIIYMNSIYDILEQKNIKYKSVEPSSLLVAKRLERRRSCVAEMLDEYKLTTDYIKLKEKEAMALVKLVRMKQEEIENDQKYIKNISKLLEKEEKEREKEKNKTFYPFNRNKNDLNSYIFDNGNDNNNTLFIINRYANYNSRNIKDRNNDNLSLLNKNKSTSNIYSIFNNKSDTLNSTFLNNNETTMTLFNKNNKNLSNKKSSIKSMINFSNFVLENDKNNDYIMKNNTYKQREDKFKKIFPSNEIHKNLNKIINYKKTSVKFKSNKNKISSNNENNENNYNLSNIPKNKHFNKTNYYNISSIFNNLSSIKNKNSRNDKIKNNKLSFISSNNKNIKDIKDKNNSKLNNNKNESFDEEDIKFDLYKNYLGLKYKLEANNNHKLKNFCSTFSSLPKKLNDKLNKSFILDEKIKETHKKYIKLIMEEKIKKFYINEEKLDN